MQICSKPYHPEFCKCPSKERLKRGVQVITKLHSILKPFLLRRVKSDVENSLPGKKELILYAHMTQQQRDFNEELRQNTLNVRPPAPLPPLCFWFCIQFI